MKRLALFLSLMVMTCTMNAQGIRIYKTDGTTSDVPVHDIDHIDFLHDMSQDVTDYSKEVLKMYVNNLGYSIPGDREQRSAVSVRLVNEAGKEILSIGGGIRVRGNSTSTLEKKPWDLKLNEKASLLGMPKDKRWVLLANYWDRTNLRNDVGLEIARRAKGMAWNPRSQFVQLYMDDNYVGLYLMCEKIKSAKNRINITEMEANAVEYPDVTGGYILEYDYTDDEKTYSTATYEYNVKIKEPDLVNKEQEQYIMGYINALEEVLKKPEQVKVHGYDKYIDINSFIDFWLVGELVMNKDFRGPASCYMYKDRNGTLCAGPVWDLDLYTFSEKVHDVNAFLLKNDCLYYKELFTDPYFVKMVKERWNTLKASLEDGDGYSIYDYINDRSSLISNEVRADDAIYPHRKYGNTLSGDEEASFADAVTMMKSFLTKRIAALDNLIGQLQ